MRFIFSIVFAIPLIAACEGPAGPAGSAGQDGLDGEMGSPCYEGLDDRNNDGVIDVLDCRGVDGIAGSDGQDGDDGQACWDLNGDGQGDVLTEDANGDGAVDVLDCAGSAGQDGQDYEPASYVGWEACETCHQAIYDKVERSGHPYKVRPVDGARPDNIQANLSMSQVPANGNAPADPPVGYAWTDISHLIGGWGWKVRFMDLQGYIITCPPGDLDSDGDGFCDTECGGTALTTCGSPGTDFVGQWNQATDGWVTYHRGEYQKKFDCGACHTTGYDPDGTTFDASGNAMPGIVGSWSEPGIRCEACHGPGSRHIGDPQAEPMRVERDAEACGSCHIRGDASAIPASGGFVKHHEQWNEMYASKKHSMRCVDCHDPHQSAGFGDNTHNPDRGSQIDCEACHFQQEANQANLARDADSPMKLIAECIDCHMPFAAKSAIGNLAAIQGDVRSHLFAINTDVSAAQFNGDGSEAMPYLTLTYACRSCHPDSQANRNGRLYSVRSDAELELSAAGYHD